MSNVLLVSTAEQASYPSLIDHDGGDYGDEGGLTAHRDASGA